MRPLYLMINEAITTLGAEKVAGRLGLSSSCVYRFGQSPEASGKDIPLKHLLALLALASGEEKLQGTIDQILTHLAAPAGRKIVRLSALREVEEALFNLKNGKSYNSVIEHCPDCDHPLKVVGKTGGLFIYRCPSGCGRGEAA